MTASEKSGREVPIACYGTFAHQVSHSNPRVGSPKAETSCVGWALRDLR
jgi:hypothetical protein